MLSLQAKLGRSSVRTAPDFELHPLYKQSLGGGLSFGKRFNGISFPLNLQHETAFLVDMEDLLQYLDRQSADLGNHKANIEVLVLEFTRLGLWPEAENKPLAEKLKDVLQVLGLSNTCYIDELMNKAYSWYQSQEEPDLAQFSKKKKLFYDLLHAHLGQFLSVEEIYNVVWPKKYEVAGVVDTENVRKMKQKLRPLLEGTKYTIQTRPAHQENWHDYGLFLRSSTL